MAVKVVDKNGDEVVKVFKELTVGDFFVIKEKLYVKASTETARSFPLFLSTAISGVTRVATVDVELHWKYQMAESEEF